MNIGEAAAATGLSSKMIRYYEQTGLIGPATRSMAGYRVYSHEDIHALHFVRRARDLGFSVKQMAELLALWRNRSRSSADVKRIALGHVAELEAKMKELEEMATVLRHLADHCHGDQRPHCPIIAELGRDGDTAKGKSERHLRPGFASRR